MNTQVLTQFLEDHLDADGLVSLCRRAGLYPPTTRQTVVARLTAWLASDPPSRSHALLSNVDRRLLLSWSREVGCPEQSRGDAITALIGRLPVHAACSRAGEANELDLNEAGAFSYDPVQAAMPSRPYQQQCLAALEAAASSDAPGRHLVQIATGGGKTRLANDWVWRRLQQGKRVLWVTKDWELLRQAARDLCARYDGAIDRMGRVGDGGRLHQLQKNPAARVVYTTIQTWAAREGKEFLSERFDDVIIDELHWGEGTKMRRRLIERYRDSRFIGLTATPRRWSDFQRVGDDYDFQYLVKHRYLARPQVLEPTRTNVQWRPIRAGDEGDFTSTSLRELATNPSRNHRIVDKYRDGAALFGKTLVFACNVGHAKQLALLFQQKGISAEALHSQMDLADRDQVRKRFRNGNTQVLVNIAMLTHGVDIPDIQTIFLARPTASPTLFWQMVGRGARLAEGKDRFNVVDFVDVVERHSDATLSAVRDLGSMFPPAPRNPKEERSPLTRTYEYAPAKILRYPGQTGHEHLQGLEYQPEQTFGIEFELTRADFDGWTRPADWEPVSIELLKALRGALGSAYVAKMPILQYHGSKDLSVWNIEPDGSCGWEVTTRILRGAAGFEEVDVASHALLEASARLGLRVDTRTGTHIHLGWKPTGRRLARLLKTVAYYEPALFSLVSPSRAQCDYCSPVREMHRDTAGLRSMRTWRDALAVEDLRYHALNLQNLFGAFGTVEVRLHNGTLESKKILTWLSLWMRILEAVERKRAPRYQGPMSTNALPLCKGVQGNIVRLARFVGAGEELTAHLVDRRSFVIENSWLRSEYRALALEVSKAWRRPSTPPLNAGGPDRGDDMRGTGGPTHLSVSRAA